MSSIVVDDEGVDCGIDVGWELGTEAVCLK